MFSPTDDPGPNFAELLRRVGLEPPAPKSSLEGTLTITHGTTCVAVRYADGVVMAGDRRATSGNLISHRAIEKVFPADRHSGVAIAGAAGPAMEMVKLFQLQLEHYEKVEALGPQPRGQGQPAVADGAQQPAGRHAGPGRGAAVRRLRPAPRDRPPVPVRRHRRPLRGEQLRLHRLGQPARRHGRQARLPRGHDRDDTLDLAINALFTAADEDSATGGPDLVRGIYPVMATITADGFERVADTEVAERFAALIEVLAAREADNPQRLPETTSDHGGLQS